jgi:hypothetical protein
MFRPSMLYRLSLLRFAAATAALVFASSAAAQTTWFVDADATGAKSGSSWPDAFTDLRAALAAAQEGDQVWVAAGLYKPDAGIGQKSLSFDLRSGVSLFGGFAGTETQLDQRDILLNPTVLSGDLHGNDDPVSFALLQLISDNSYHVVSCLDTTSPATIDGFTISGGVGLTNAPAGACDTSVGGGLVVSNAAVMIRSCTFTQNQANLGGGVYIGTSADVAVESCTFTGNVSQTVGGAGLALCGSGGVVSDTRFEGNVAKADGVGGGLLAGNDSSPHIVGCKFVGNTAQGGAGLAAWEGSSPLVERCLFLDNSATNGAVLFQGSGPGQSSDGTLRSCALLDNEADSGGAIAVLTSSPTIESCTIVGNRADSPDAGGLLVDGQSPAVVVRDCILWANTGAGVVSEAAQISDATASSDALVDHSDIDQWTQGGPGNIAADPAFVDLDGADDVFGTEDDDVALMPLSPCVDTGSPQVYLLGTDLLGGARFIDGNLDNFMVADMGAAEYSAVRLHAEVVGTDTKQVTVAVEADEPLWGYLLVGLDESELFLPPIGSVFVDMSQPFGRIEVGVLPFAQTFTVPDDPALPRRLLLQVVGIKPAQGVGNVSNAVWLEL